MPMPHFATARPRRAKLLAALLLVLGGSGAQADTLLDLYHAAQPYDATYLAARAQAEADQYRAEQANALRLPSVGLGLSGTRTRIDPSSTPTNPSGRQLDSTVYNAALRGQQPLFNRANAATIAQAQRSLEISSANLQLAEQELLVRVSQAYFDVLAAQDTLATARSGKTAIEQQLASAKRNFEVGTATITDTREAQARFDLSRAQEIAADNDLRTRRVVLDQLVGRSNVQPDPLAQPMVLPPVLPADAESWVMLGADEHPQIRRARTALEIARLETEKARAGHLPTVDLVGSLGSQHQSGSAVFGQPRDATSAAIGVQMNLPLFAGFAVQNRIKETLALEDKAANDLDAVRRGVATATRQVFFSLQSGQAQVRALEAAEASSKLGLEATQLGYKVGVRVSLDVLNAQAQLYQTQRDLAAARYNVLLGTLRLRQAAGRLLPEDLVPINQLLALPSQAVQPVQPVQPLPAPILVPAPVPPVTAPGVTRP